MATFNPGTGGSVAATTLENQLYTIIRQTHSKQLDPAINPENRADCVDTSIVEDTGVLTGTIRLYVMITHSDGTSEIAYPDPFVDAGWVEGTGGSGSATNYNHALADRAMMLIAAERAAAVDPLRLTNPVLTVLNSTLNIPVQHNARLTVALNLNLDAIASADGSSYKAREYVIG